MKIVLTTSLIAACFGLAVAACDQKPAAGPAKKTDTHEHKDGDGHDHKDEGHSHGPVTELGEQTAGAFKVTAKREGGVTAGKEATFNVTVSGGTPAAVRVWVGVESAEGSTKTKADKEGDHFHAHADAPSPLPAGSKLWVEVENDKGEKSVASFDLKL